MFPVKDLEKTQPAVSQRLQERSTLFLIGVSVTGNVCSKASPEEEAHVQESSMLQLEQVVSIVRGAKLPELQYSYGYMLDNNKQILVVTQHHHILIQAMENGIASGKPEVHRLVLILHATTSLKAVLPFDFNTSGQKPSTLHTHFTHPY